MTYRIGAARAEITPDCIGAVMMGWGDNNHKVEGVATPLYSRAIALEDGASGSRIIMVCVDLCFITEALRLEVVSRLGIRDDEIMLSATHTHSAPGPYSTYVVYALTVNGFSKEILETYVSGVVASVRAAIARLQPGEIRYSSGFFPLDQPVAFNRSVRAYNLNPEVEKCSRLQRHLALDREMHLLRFDTLDGKPIASWNWFAVHTTSMHRNRHQIHSDNKGVAATLLEQQLTSEGTPDFVGVFAQGAAGDVSPNFRRYLFLREKRGVDRDDEKSCLANARLQSAKAYEIFQKARDESAITGPLACFSEYHDLSNVEIDPRWVGGRKNLRTGPSEVGLSQLAGTAEGRGAPAPLILFLAFVIRVSQLFVFFNDWCKGRKSHWPFSDDPIQGNKITVIAAGRSKVFGTSRLDALVFPSWTHPTVRLLKRWGKSGYLKNIPFTPQVLPLQLIRIGDLMIAAVPAEFTTTSGRRVCKMVLETMVEHGVHRALLQGYANAGSSYVVTPEEYPTRSYEAGCTLFGRWTLPAYITLLHRMCEKMRHGESPSALRPAKKSEEYLKTLEVKL